MMLNSLLKSTPSRAVLASIAAYLFIATLFLWAMFSWVASTVEDNIERRVDWTFETLVDKIDPQDPSSIKSVLMSRLSTANPRLEIYALQNGKGEYVLTNYPYPIIQEEEFFVLPDIGETYCEDMQKYSYGQNLPRSLCEDQQVEIRDDDDEDTGVSLIGVSDLMPSNPHTEGYLARQDSLGDFTLIIGYSLDIADETRDASLLLAMVFIPLSLLMAMIVGLSVNRSIKRRISVINQHCVEIEKTGNPALRIPNTYPDDEYGKLTGHVNAMLTRLDQAVTQIKGVSDDIAHDLRTPLTRLKYGFESALSQDNKSTNELRETLEKGLGETDKLLNTFASTLRISQIQTGQRRSKFTSVDLASILPPLIEVYEPVALENGHDLTIEVKNAPVIIRGDGDMIQQLVANLIENSFEHGGGKLTVKIICQKKDSGVILSIQDNGQGINENEHARIFDKFYRGQSSRAGDGTGLGLSLVKAITDLHDARIHTGSNEPGLKTVITFPSLKTP